MKFQTIDEIKGTKLEKYKRHQFKGARFYRSPSESGGQLGSGESLPNTAAGYKIRMPEKPQQFVDSKEELIEMLSTL